jgi:hypothetical protein
MSEKYPKDWLCICGHKQSDHGNIVARKGDVPYTEGPFITENGCQLRQPNDSGWLDGCVNYLPVDNLTYVELLATEKKV